MFIYYFLKIKYWLTMTVEVVIMVLRITRSKVLKKS